MTEQERPPRSLRGEGGPRVYRDWSASDEVLSQNSYDVGLDEEELLNSPQEMHMLEEIAEEPASVAEVRSAGPVYAELPPLPVIMPAEAPPATTPPPEEKPKVQITRVNKPTIQRARRYSELKAEEEQRERDAAAEAARRQAKIQHEMPSHTRGLPQGSGKTTELRQNIKEISEKIDETAENVKSTANSITENIRQIGDKLSVSVAEGVKKVGHQLAGMINRWSKKSSAPSQPLEDEDFEDEPLPNAPRPAVQPPAPEAPTAPPREVSLLDQVPPVPPVAIAAVLKEGIRFLTFEKKSLPSKPDLPEKELQELFIREALDDIRKCIKLVQKLPTPSEGPYQGIPLTYLFKNVRDQDIFFFLHYVQAHPGAFKDKEFKLAEAFASWVLKRSQKTMITEPFPEVPALDYFPLYKQNIRFLTVQKKAMVLATGKSAKEVNELFMSNALADVKACVDFVAQFPPPEQGPYKGRPMRQIFRNVSEKDIYFFLHYVQSQPEIFQNQNFKFSEAFASWLLKRSHETPLP